MHSPYYPLFVRLEGRICLVVGGGAVGERKIRMLLSHGGTVRLIARTLTPWIEEQHARGQIQWVSEHYDPAHLDGVDFVFAATNDLALNRRIAEDAGERRIWTNMATEPETGSFIVPALVEQGPLSIAISTAGFSPALAKIIREKLETEFGHEWSVFLVLMGRLREAIQSVGLESSENQRLFREIARLPLPEWIRKDRRDSALEALQAVCGPLLGTDRLHRIMDEAWKASSS